MELIAGVGRQSTFLQDFEMVQRQTVNRPELVKRQRIVRRIKIKQVPQHETAGITNPTVGFGHPVENFIGNPVIVTIVLCRTPQSQYVGAILLDDILRRNDIPHRLTHLTSLTIQNKAMGQDRMVGGVAAGANRLKQ